ncbi:hypothetical protein [Pseudomonas sp. PLMAX]|uniref:hypothetical protein n=1 Tax=Pseudomonas sp. PLMAX TaxID=2201998 RepID=UPI0038BB8FBE
MSLGAETPKSYRTGETPMPGDRVKIADDRIDTFLLSVHSRIRDREGVLRSFSFPSSKPMVFFPALGRRKDYELGQVDMQDLMFIGRAL